MQTCIIIAAVTFQTEILISNQIRLIAYGNSFQPIAVLPVFKLGPFVDPMTRSCTLRSQILPHQQGVIIKSNICPFHIDRLAANDLTVNIVIGNTIADSIDLCRSTAGKLDCITVSRMRIHSLDPGMTFETNRISIESCSIIDIVKGTVAAAPISKLQCCFININQNLISFNIQITAA